MSAIEELEIVLDNEISEYDTLITAVKEEQSALIGNHLDAIDTILEGQNVSIGKIETLEQKRKQIYCTIAKTMAIENSEVSLQKLIGLTPEPHSSKLRSLYNRLAENLDRLHSLNHTNLALIQNGIKHNEMVFKLLAYGNIEPTPALTQQRQSVLNIQS